MLPNAQKLGLFTKSSDTFATTRRGITTFSGKARNFLIGFQQPTKSMDVTF